MVSSSPALHYILFCAAVFVYFIVVILAVLMLEAISWITLFLICLLAQAFFMLVEAFTPSIQKQYLDKFADKGANAPKHQTECTICVEEYKPDDKIVVLMDCFTPHAFHYSCLLMWFEKSRGANWRS